MSLSSAFHRAGSAEGFVALPSTSRTGFVLTQSQGRLRPHSNLLLFVHNSFRSNCCLFTCHETWHWLVPAIKINCSGAGLQSGGGSWERKRGHTPPVCFVELRVRSKVLRRDLPQVITPGQIAGWGQEPGSCHGCCCKLQKEKNIVQGMMSLFVALRNYPTDWKR